MGFFISFSAEAAGALEEEAEAAQAEASYRLFF